MQGKHSYEYAIIRVVPRVEREEFINVGVILFSKHAKFIGMKYFLDEKKINLFSPDFEIGMLTKTLDSFEKICYGDASAGVIAGFDIPERFRWLTAVRSACVQTSRPHPGYSSHPEKTLEKLFEDLVL